MGASGPARHHLSAGVRRRRSRRADLPGVRRGAVALDLRRLRRHGAGAHRHGLARICVHAGTRRRCERYLPGIIGGELITAVGITEPDAGSDVAGIRTRARREGDDWVLNGTKMFITNGVHADLYFIAARTDPDAKGSRGISMFIVEKGTPGFRVGRALKKTGWLSLGHRRAGVRRLPRSRGQSARRGEQRLLRGDEELPDRAHRAGRHGGGPLPDRAGADAGLRAAAQGLRRDAVRQAGDPPAAGDAGGQDRGRTAVHVPLRLAA